MSSSYATILILCMAVTALIPRIIPAVLADKMHFGAKTEKFLKLIPYTAMAALIFPGVLTVDSARPQVGLIGAAVAAVLAWKKCPVMVCVLVSIAAVFVLYLF